MSVGEKSSFCSILERAIAGDQTALEAIFRMYDPMLRKYSMWNGKEDEDLRQYIMIRVALNISKFVI